MYPSIDLEFNIAPNTLIGKVEIPNKVYKDENHYKIDKYSRAGEFTENMVTDNHIEFCKRWFHLAGFKELLEDANELFAAKMFCSRSYIESYNSFGDILEVPIVPTNNYISTPLVFTGDYSGITKPLHFKLDKEFANRLRGGNNEYT